MLQVIFLAVILLWAVWVRLQNIHIGMGYDEIFTAINFIDTPTFWDTISRYIEFNNHIGYSVCAKISQGILGRGEWTLRLPALIFGIISIVTFHKYAKQYTGTFFCLLAVAFFSLNPDHIYYSQQVRGYSGFILFTMLSHMYFIQNLKFPYHRRYFIPYIVVNVVGIYIHLYSAIVPFAQFSFLAYLWLLRRLPGVSRERIFSLGKAVMIITALSFILYLPVIQQVMMNVTRNGQSPIKWNLPLETLKHFVGLKYWWALLSAILIVSIGWIKLRRRDVIEADYFLMVIVLPMALMMSLQPKFLFPRFFLYYLPIFTILVFIGVEVIWSFLLKRRPIVLKRIAVACFAAAIAFAGLYSVQMSTKKFPIPGYRSAVIAVMENFHKEVGLCAIGGSPSLFSYYASEKFNIPRSMQEFKNLTTQYDEIRCAYHKRPWEHNLHTQIGEYLEKRAQLKQQFGIVYVFYYTPVTKN